MAARRNTPCPALSGSFINPQKGKTRPLEGGRVRQSYSAENGESTTARHIDRRELRVRRGTRTVERGDDREGPHAELWGQGINMEQIGAMND
jgi:hypothetical protein